MLSYGLLYRALAVVPLTPQRIFEFSISSAASGFIGHSAYVAAAESISHKRLLDRVIDENVSQLVGADVNPVMHLLLAADSEDDFAQCWNRYNEIAGLGVRTVLRSSVDRSFVRQPQGSLSDSNPRRKLMTRFIDELYSRRGERRARRQSRSLSETATVLGISETPSGAVASVLEEFLHANVQQCAKKLGCSVRTLQRHLCLGGVSFAQIRHATRVSLAANLIASSGDPMSEIAVAAGFYDASHFIKAIRRSTGITPCQLKALTLDRNLAPRG